ncbi:MAG: metal ABC transporter permease [Verrucomicrobiota bacterium]|nr:metal ABC transporter permease [Verrucomicrobiota bacterium]
MLSTFFQALNNPDLPFLRQTLGLVLLASVAFGLVGTIVVARRLSALAGAVAHSVLGGIGAALYFQRVVGVTWLNPMLGALLAATVAALIIGWVSLYAKDREDTVIGALWAMGMAIGLLFLARTPGFTDPNSYLFGNILMISSADLWRVLALNIALIAGLFLGYNRLQALCFDPEFARLRGVPANLLYLLLLVVVAVTVVFLINIAGTVLVIALLTIPAALAGYITRHLWQMMLAAIAFAAVFCTSGLAVSYQYDLPTGPVIIAIAGTAYLGAAVTMKFRKGR